VEGVDRGGDHWRNARSYGDSRTGETDDVDEAGGSLASEQYAAEGRETMERQVVSRPSSPSALSLLQRLLHDFSLRSVPDTMRLKVTGHTANIKCVDFIGVEAGYAVSGSR